MPPHHLRIFIAQPSVASHGFPLLQNHKLPAQLPLTRTPRPFNTETLLHHHRESRTNRNYTVASHVVARSRPRNPQPPLYCSLQQPRHPEAKSTTLLLLPQITTIPSPHETVCTSVLALKNSILSQIPTTLKPLPTQPHKTPLTQRMPEDRPPSLDAALGDPCP